jgi:hypothetical protein
VNKDCTNSEFEPNQFQAIRSLELELVGIGASLWQIGLSLKIELTVSNVEWKRDHLKILAAQMKG